MIEVSSKVWHCSQIESFVGGVDGLLGGWAGRFAISKGGPFGVVAVAVESP